MSVNGQIWAFGNSHVSIFSGTDTMVPIWPARSVDTLPWFRTIRLGACTAYQAMKWIKEIVAIIDLELLSFDKEKDTILLVFGEVDIRAHITTQAEKQGKSISEVTLEIVERYSEAIQFLKDNGFNLAVFGCVVLGSMYCPGSNSSKVCGICSFLNKSDKNLAKGNSCLERLLKEIICFVRSNICCDIHTPL